MKTKKHSRIKQIKKRLRFKTYNENHYFDICPVEVFDKNRHAKIAAWRHLGLVWATLATGNASEAQRRLNLQNHCAVSLYAQQRFLNMLDGFPDPDFQAAYETLLNHIENEN